MKLPESIKLHPDVRFRAVPPEGVLVNQRNAEVLVVNDLGLRVVELLQGTCSHRQVLQELQKEYDASPTTIATDVDSFLKDLQTRGLLVEANS